MTCEIEDLSLDHPSTTGSSKFNLFSWPKSRKETNGCRRKEPVCVQSFMPERYAVACKTWGCTHNTADSERMLGLIDSHGYRIVDSLDDADVWILNTCTAKTPSEDRFKHVMDTGLKLEKTVILTGCIPEADKKTYESDNCSMVGVHHIDKIADVIEAAVQGNRCIMVGPVADNQQLPSLSTPRIRKNRFVEIIPISSGCLNYCTYCKTKLARGDLCSYPPDDIRQRCFDVFAEGVKEIWFTSEDLGAYGLDIGWDLARLISHILPVVPDDCMIRLGMTNPPYILDLLTPIVEILSHPRVYAFLHIPVQCGSDSVLMDMRREYCVADFRKIVDTVRQRVPGGVHIATDVICGFPTETDVDFEQTTELLEHLRLPSVYINQFYPRTGTEAATMRQLSTKTKRDRTRAVTALFKSYQTFDHMLGSLHRCLFTEVSRHGRELVGHTKRYEQVLADSSDQAIELGNWYWVKVVQCNKYSMRVVRIDDNTSCTADRMESRWIKSKDYFLSSCQNAIHFAMRVTTVMILLQSSFLIFKKFYY